MQRLLAPREAANILGISYPTLKQWIYRGKLKTAKTPGGHHRVPESEIDRLIPKSLERGEPSSRRGAFRKISGRNQLIGRIVAIKYDGLLAQITLRIGEQTRRKGGRAGQRAFEPLHFQYVDADHVGERNARYSTVTVFARLRG